MNSDVADSSLRETTKPSGGRRRTVADAEHEALDKLLPSEIEAINAKQREAWNKVWPMLWPIALQKACKLLGSEDRGREAAADVLGDLYEKPWETPLKDGSHFRRLVLVAVRNRCNTEHRSNKVRQNKWRIAAIGEHLYGSVKNAISIPSSCAQRQELKAKLTQLLDRLEKDEYREWIEDHVLEGMTIDEIVSRYNRPRGTVSGYLRRAIAALRAMAKADQKMQEFKQSYNVAESASKGGKSNKKKE